MPLPACNRSLHPAPALHPARPQSTAGYIGTAGIVLGNLVGLGLGRVIDVVPPGGAGRKALLVGFNALAAAAVVYFALAVQGLLPFVVGDAGFWQVAASATTLSMCLNSLVPVFFELAIEVRER